MLAISTAQDVEVIGTYPNGSTSKYTYALKGIDISGEVRASKEITSVPLNSWSQYLIDVSMFNSVTISKITTSGELKFVSYLSARMLNDSDYFGYNNFSKFKRSAGVFNASDLIPITQAVKENAIIVKISNTEDITSFRLFVEDAQFTKRWYNITKGEYMQNRDTLPAGTTYIAIPIETKESIAFTNVGGGTITGSYKFENFDFKLDGNRLYWEKQNGAVGSANEIKKPKEAKWAKVTLFGPSSAGMSIVLYGKKASILAANPNSLLRYHLTSNLPLYNAISKARIFDSVVPITTDQTAYYFNVENFDTISLASGTGSPLVDLKTIFNFYSDLESTIKDAIIGTSNTADNTDKYFQNANILPFFEDSKMVVLKDISSKRLRGLFKDIAVWHNSTSLSISRTGIDGEQVVVDLTSANFPNLISGSTIEHVIILHWTRYNNTVPSESYRINVITTKGQVYHNHPSRALTHDGAEQANDWFTFEESVIWDIENKTTPVKTRSGNDAVLISTGKYNYFPALPDEAYEFHPAIDQPSPYGNSGFGSVSEKTQADNTTIKFSRFYFTDRSNGLQANPFGFMGGFATHPKLSMLATYKSNSDRPTRICLFMTNDGGRQWYCRWEAGITGERKFANGTLASVAIPTFLGRKLVTTQMSAPAASDMFNVVKRTQYIPDSSNKEIDKTQKFTYGAPFGVASITANVGDITVVTTTPHGFNNGELILFEKQNGTVSEWDWIVNTGHSALSSGSGVYFKANVVNNTTFTLEEAVGQHDNNLTVRHIHSLNRCKDGYSFGCGETYPEGWCFWIPVRESDNFIRKYPWDHFDFIRLNSVRESVQRPLGFTLEHDNDNTVFVGIDNEYTILPNVALPAGRTDTFKRSSNGAWKGKLVDFDDQSKFECVFPSDEVCYLFKRINGVFVYTGQQGHVGMSRSGEKNTWSECRAPWTPQRFGGTNTDGWFVIDGLLFKYK
ncbi:hypothetical protein AAW12_15905 [Sphingobacterium sp. Ag1]|nr:hypothetical protein AAW12_15905 [Sphingobacterium sp. Ag1]